MPYATTAGVLRIDPIDNCTDYRCSVSMGGSDIDSNRNDGEKDDINISILPFPVTSSNDGREMYTQVGNFNWHGGVYNEVRSTHLLLSLLLRSLTMMMVMEMMLMLSILTSAISASCSFYSYIPPLLLPSPSFLIHYTLSSSASRETDIYTHSRPMQKVSASPSPCCSSLIIIIIVVIMSMLTSSTLCFLLLLFIYSSLLYSSSFSPSLTLPLLQSLTIPYTCL